MAWPKGKQRPFVRAELNDPAWLRAEYEGCMRSIPSIAEELGISTSPVARALRRYGIVVRPAGMDNRVHGMTGTPTWESWAALHKRCDNPNHKAYERYGGRGITLCQGWRGTQGFVNFYADLGERPPGLTLDRIDNDGGYWCGHCPECLANKWPANCRWTDWETQNNNRRLRHSSSPQACPHCSDTVGARGHAAHVGICQRNLLIAKCFYKVGSRHVVAREFGVSEQVVKRCARRYRALTNTEGEI